MTDAEIAIRDGRGLIKAVGPRAFFVGVHNAFAHGAALKLANLEVDDDQLGKAFESFEELIKFGKKVEKANGL